MCFEYCMEGLERLVASAIKIERKEHHTVYAKSKQKSCQNDDVHTINIMGKPETDEGGEPCDIILRYV